MKKQICAAVLAGALAGGNTVGALSNASQPSDTPTNDTIVNTDQQSGTVMTNTGEVYPTYWLGFSSEEATHYLLQQDPQLASAELLTYNQIEPLVRSYNRTVLANRETFAAMEAVDIEQAIDDMKKAISSMEEAIVSMNELAGGVAMSLETVDPTIQNGAATLAIGSATVVLLQSNIAQMESQLAQMKEQLTELRKTDYEPYERQFAYIENQLVMAAQASYMGLMTIQQNYLAMVEQADLTNVQYNEMQLRYQLGQVSALDVSQVRTAKEQTDSAIQSLAATLRDAKSDFALLIGRDPALNFLLDTLTQITPDMLAKLSLQSDLDKAETLSYDIYKAEQALDEAEDLDRDEDGRDEKIRAATYQLDNTKETFRQNFHKLFRAVAEKNRLLVIAQRALTTQASATVAAKLQYEQGQISRNRYIEATASQGKAESNVLLAQIDLCSAYLQYQWACQGVMTTGGTA